MGNVTDQLSELELEQTNSVLEHMLTLSYEERIDAHQAALELVLELQRAGQTYYAEQS